jgi:hypothetical protein
MVEHLDNVAGRLAATLRPLASFAPNISAQQAWAEILKAEDTEQLLGRISRLVGLLEDTKRAIRELPEDEDRDFYLGPFVDIDNLPPRFITHFGTGNIDAFQQGVPQHAMVGLDAASRILRRTSLRDPVISEEGRTSLLEDVRALLNEVASHPDLEQGAKLYVIKLLRDVETALLGYVVGGFDDVMSAVAAVSAGATRITEDEQRGWLVAAVGRLWAATVSRAQGVQAITGAAQGVVAAVGAVKHIIG